MGVAAPHLFVLHFPRVVSQHCLRSLHPTLVRHACGGDSRSCCHLQMRGKGVPMGETFHGTCLCRRVRFDVRDPEEMSACHCTRCQRWSGGTSSWSVEVEEPNSEVRAGQELIEHFTEEGFTGVAFCSNCGLEPVRVRRREVLRVRGNAPGPEASTRVPHDGRLQGALGRDQRRRPAVPRASARGLAGQTRRLRRSPAAGVRYQPMRSASPCTNALGAAESLAEP